MHLRVKAAKCRPADSVRMPFVCDKLARPPPPRTAQPNFQGSEPTLVTGELRVARSAPAHATYFFLEDGSARCGQPHRHASRVLALSCQNTSAALRLSRSKHPTRRRNHGRERRWLHPGKGCGGWRANGELARLYTFHQRSKSRAEHRPFSLQR